jgi:hypothetical protein
VDIISSKPHGRKPTMAQLMDHDITPLLEFIVEVDRVEASRPVVKSLKRGDWFSHIAVGSWSGETFYTDFCTSSNCHDEASYHIQTSL